MLLCHHEADCSVRPPRTDWWPAAGWDWTKFLTKSLPKFLAQIGLFTGIDIAIDHVSNNGREVTLAISDDRISGMTEKAMDAKLEKMFEFVLQKFTELTSSKPGGYAPMAVVNPMQAPATESAGYEMVKTTTATMYESSHGVIYGLLVSAGLFLFAGTVYFTNKFKNDRRRQRMAAVPDRV